MIKSHTQQVRVDMERAVLDRLLKKLKSTDLSDYLRMKLREDLLKHF